MPLVSQVSKMPRGKLRLSQAKARTHSKKQIQQIARSIQRFGWTFPILTDERGYIVAGVGRYRAAESLDISDVPVIVISGLSEVEKRALALADNKLAENSEWDRA